MLRVELERQDSPRAKKKIDKGICTAESPAFYWQSSDGLCVAALTGKGIIKALLPGPWGVSRIVGGVDEENLKFGKRKVLKESGHSLIIYRSSDK